MILNISIAQHVKKIVRRLGKKGLDYFNIQAKRKLPRTVQVSVCDACNFRCTSCWIYGDSVTAGDSNYEASLFKSQHPAMMSIETFKSFLDSLPKYSGLREIQFCGKGEPSLNPHLVDMVRLACDAGFSTSVVTNGSRLSLQMLREMASSGTFVNVSLNAVDNTQHRKFSGINKDMFPNIVSTLESANNAEFANLRRGISFVVGGYNIDTMSQMVDIAVRILPSGSTASFYAEWVHQGSTGNRCSEVQFRMMMAQLSKMKEQLDEKTISHNLNVFPFVLYAIHLSNDQGQPTKALFTNRGCSVVDNFACVLADGRVIPCCRSGLVLGDIHDQEFSMIYNSEFAYRMRGMAHDLPRRGCEVPSTHCYSCDHMMNDKFFEARYGDAVGALCNPPNN